MWYFFLGIAFIHSQIYRDIVPETPQSPSLCMKPRKVRRPPTEQMLQWMEEIWHQLGPMYNAVIIGLEGM